jgi:RNA methyltransferase, TrmH family
MDMNKEPLCITSLKNDQIKDLVRLRNRRERDRTGLTIIEEPLVIDQAVKAGYPLNKVFFCPDQIAENDLELLDQLLILCRETGASSPRAVELTSPVMDKVSYREKSEGLLVVAPQIRTELEDLKLGRGGQEPLVVVLEAVEKPGNLGAALRVADGAGADAVLICGHGTDLFNPNVLRASRGSFFSVPSVAADSEVLVEYLHDLGVSLVAASPIADQSWNEVDLTGPVAIVLGTEHDGLSPKMMSLCDLSVGIPMLGSGDSLNVSTSAAILLYEAVRQRRGKPKGTA